MKKLVTIALLLGVSVLGLQASDWRYGRDWENATNPWEPTKKERKHFENKYSHVLGEVYRDREGLNSNYTIPQLEAIYEGKAKPTAKEYIHQGRKGARYINMNLRDSILQNSVIAQEIERRKQRTRKLQQEKEALNEYRLQGYQPQFWGGNFRNWITSWYSK